MEKPTSETMLATAKNIISGITKAENATIVVAYIHPNKTTDEIHSEAVALIGNNHETNIVTMIFAIQLAYGAALRSGAPPELIASLKSMVDAFTEAEAEAAEHIASEDAAKEAEVVPFSRERSAYLH